MAERYLVLNAQIAKHERALLGLQLHLNIFCREAPAERPWPYERAYDEQHHTVAVLRDCRDRPLHW